MNGVVFIIESRGDNDGDPWRPDEDGVQFLSASAARAAIDELVAAYSARGQWLPRMRVTALIPLPTESAAVRSHDAQHEQGA